MSGTGGATLIKGTNRRRALSHGFYVTIIN